MIISLTLNTGDRTYYSVFLFLIVLTFKFSDCDPDFITTAADTTGYIDGLSTNVVNEFNNGSTQNRYIDEWTTSRNSDEYLSSITSDKDKGPGVEAINGTGGTTSGTQHSRATTVTPSDRREINMMWSNTSDCNQTMKKCDKNMSSTAHDQDIHGSDNGQSGNMMAGVSGDIVTDNSSVPGHIHGPNDSNIIALDQDTGNRSRGGRLLDQGTLTQAQHDEYIEIIKSVKWALNSVALLMTVLAIISFLRTRAKSSSTTFIIALNIFEAVAALLSIVGYALNSTLGGTSMEYLMYTQSMSMYVTAVCRRIVYLLNMLMSGQRLTVVAFPFIARTAFRNRFNVAVVVSVVIIVFAVHAYIPVQYTIEDMGGGVHRLANSQLYNDHEDDFELVATVCKFLFAFIPLVASLIANGLLLLHLKRHNDKVGSLRATPTIGPTNNRQERQVSMMVLVSSLSFTLLCLPANVHLLVTTYTTDYGYYKREHYLFLVVHESLVGLLTLGDITNFLSYLILSSAFRSQLIAAILPMCSVSCRRTHSNRTSSTCVTTPM